MGAGAVDPRMLALAVEQLRTALAGPLSDGQRGFFAATLVELMVQQYTFSDDPKDLERAVRCGANSWPCCRPPARGTSSCCAWWRCTGTTTGWCTSPRRRSPGRPTGWPGHSPGCRRCR
ncbi:hypothetical protein STENM223S_09182 [Streptomyces tendae]